MSSPKLLGFLPNLGVAQAVEFYDVREERLFSGPAGTRSL
jgi:hypothetical protein